ncbi:unnamed protein product [Linum trigynum]|uniref:Late embryogenesis abundant protein LEA-2 subgroup domain-containing protein n=1 Tax=Linum trigynum TaxID=586398 RepID=A0AAV2FHE7_9ROSI
MSKETATRPTKLYFSIVFTVVFFISLILLICWLSLRPHEPKFHVHNFSVLGLADHGFESVRFVYNVSVRNSNRRVGISYDTLTTAIYHNGRPIGITPSFNSFDQEPKTTLYISHVLTGGAIAAAAGSGDTWKEIVGDRGSGKVEFQLELRTSLRYERTMWDLRRHGVRAKCQVPVGGDGALLAGYVGQECPS